MRLTYNLTTCRVHQLCGPLHLSCATLGGEAGGVGRRGHRDAGPSGAHGGSLGAETTMVSGGHVPVVRCDIGDRVLEPVAAGFKFCSEELMEPHLDFQDLHLYLFR